MSAGTLLHRNEVAKFSSAPRKEGAKSPGKSLALSLLTLNPSLCARKSVQRYLISRGNAASESAVGEFHGRVRSWVSEAPSVFFRSTGLLEREQ